MLPQEKLAVSLEHLKAIQDEGHRVVRASMLSRTHRERRGKAGYLQEVIKGWYLPTQPGAFDNVEGSTAAWLSGMRDFVAGYCTVRFRQGWHLSPDLSLRLLAGERSLPRQLQVWAASGNNQQVQLPLGYSLFLYRPPQMLAAQPHAEHADMRLVGLEEALIAVSPSFFERHPLSARIALDMLADVPALLQKLLEGGHSSIAGRLSGAFRAVGRKEVTNRITQTLRSAGYTVQETSPLETPPQPCASSHNVSPYGQRLRLCWASMRETVIAAFPAPLRLPTTFWTPYGVLKRAMWRMPTTPCP